MQAELTRVRSRFGEKKEKKRENKMVRKQSWFLRNRVSDEGSLSRWITGTPDEVEYRMPLQAHWLAKTTCGGEGELGIHDQG